MGWTCQHDYQGYCKLVKKPCIPGMKGCTLKGNFIFSTQPKTDVNKDETEEEIDFVSLVRSN